MKNSREIKTIFISTKGLNKSIKNFPSKYMELFKSRIEHMKVDSTLKETMCEQVNNQLEKKAD